MRDNILKILIILMLSIFIIGCTSNVKVHKYTPLHDAVRLNQIDNVKLLIDKVNINKLDSFKESPLVDAVRNNSSEISKILICNGSNLNILDSNQNTLSNLAISNNNTEILKFILSKNKSSICSDYILHKQIKKAIVKKDIINENKAIKEINLVKKFDSSILLLNKNNLIINELSNIKLSYKDNFNTNFITFEFHNSGDLNEDFKNRLNILMNDITPILKKYINKIEEVVVKSYTSSEYKSRSTIIGKFMANMKVSQNRADKIKEFITSKIYASNNLKKLFTSVGMSSQDIILNKDGSENKLLSRRTTLEIVLK